MKQRKVVEEEVERLHRTLDMLKYKCWYYEKAIADGNEDQLHSITPRKICRRTFV